MFDIENVLEFKESNRLEVKSAQRGLPRSLWETYSAFANTDGGIILLGVEEDLNKNLNVIGVSKAEEIIKDFFDNINNPQKVSINLITDKNVQIHTIKDKNIISVEVPRALRTDKPVYINSNVLSGTYRRNGEGDYHCNQQEIKNMLRDSGDEKQDLLVLQNVGYEALDKDSIKRYRIRMSNLKPGHVWEELEDREFLIKIGAIDRINNQDIHPTVAGLLMFGYEYEIVKEFPNYFLDYREIYDDSKRWSDRIVSSSGDWSGNLFDFYFRAYGKIVEDIKIPFKLENGIDRIDNTPMHIALREALANAVIHSNYYERQGLVVEKHREKIQISNPGSLRISIQEAIGGGKSDPRNATIIKMFSLINIGERAGSGLTNIYLVWENEKLQKPQFFEKFNPDRITLILPLEKIGDKKIGDKKIGDKKIGDKKIGDKKVTIKEKNMDLIMKYFLEVERTTTKEVSNYLGLKESRTRDYLQELVNSGKIIAEGSSKKREYILK